MIGIDLALIDTPLTWTILLFIVPLGGSLVALFDKNRIGAVIMLPFFVALGYFAWQHQEEITTEAYIAALEEHYGVHFLDPDEVELDPALDDGVRTEVRFYDPSDVMSEYEGRLLNVEEGRVALLVSEEDGEEGSPNQVEWENAAN